MRKYAGELRVGDVWTERPQNRVAQSYRVIGIAPGLASTTMRVIAECDHSAETHSGLPSVQPG